MKKLIVMVVLGLAFASNAYAGTYGYFGEDNGTYYKGTTASPNLVGQVFYNEVEASMVREEVKKPVLGNNVIVEMANRLNEEDRPYFYEMVKRAGIRF